MNQELEGVFALMSVQREVTKTVGIVINSIDNILVARHPFELAVRRRVVPGRVDVM